MNIHFHGLVAAALTPFDAKGELALDRVPVLRDFLRSRGVGGVFVGGTTGEWPFLSTAERLALAKAWLTQRAQGLKVLIHVGNTSLRAARELAAQAESLGADAIATVAPLIFKPSTIDELVSYCAEIASAAPSTPFYFYHFPALTGFSASGIDILRAASKRIPNFRGLKYTHETLADYLACTQFAEGYYDILYGRDEMFLASLAMGARAAIGSTYNFASPIFVRLQEAFDAGHLDEALEWQTKANEVLALCGQYGGGKGMMDALGCSCGPYRSPLKSASAEMVHQLRVALKSKGLWDVLTVPAPAFATAE